MVNRSLFHKDFIFGVSTSAFQTEGSHLADGKGKSIWDTFSEKKGKIKRNQDARQATNFYKYYRQDLDYIDWMNCKNFRFSISWSRLFPEGIGKINNKGVDFYNRLIDNCLEMDIDPWITLYHWDLPQSLEQKGGWTNRDILSWFEEYVQFAVAKYSDRVKNWMVLNEPTAFTGLGYFMGIHAPGKKGLRNFLPSMHHAAMAQAAGGRLIKSIDSQLNVGTTFSFSHVEAYKVSKKNERARVKVDALLNRLYLEPLLGMGYPLEDLPGLNKVEKYMQDGDEKLLAHDFDFIGVQNYSREIVKHSYLTPIVNASLVTAKKRNKPHTEMGWEVYPKSIYEVLTRLNTYENIPPLLVTESGAAFKDELSVEGRVNDDKRIMFFKKSIQEVAKATESGVNLKGYFIWSLTDNFEWAEGYHPRFGLIYIDYKKLKRVPKDSAFWYKDFLMT
ncbi:MAG: GH1 family beta-glucosidase [Vicingaceae bacterium]